MQPTRRLQMGLLRLRLRALRLLGRVLWGRVLRLRALLRMGEVWLLCRRVRKIQAAL